jgi:hypothetical protein
MTADITTKTKMAAELLVRLREAFRNLPFPFDPNIQAQDALEHSFMAASSTSFTSTDAWPLSEAAACWTILKIRILPAEGDFQALRLILYDIQNPKIVYSFADAIQVQWLRFVFAPCRRIPIPPAARGQYWGRLSDAAYREEIDANLVLSDFLSRGRRALHEHLSVSVAFVLIECIADYVYPKL